MTLKMWTFTTLYAMRTDPAAQSVISRIIPVCLSAQSAAVIEQAESDQQAFLEAQIDNREYLATLFGHEGEESELLYAFYGQLEKQPPQLLLYPRLTIHLETAKPELGQMERIVSRPSCRTAMLTDVLQQFRYRHCEPIAPQVLVRSADVETYNTYKAESTGAFHEEL